MRRCLSLARIRFDYVKLLYNAALKFDAALNVLVFPLDVGKRCAGLIPHAPKKYPIEASIRRQSGTSDDLRRIDEHIAEARRLVQRQKGLIIRLRAGSSTWDAQRVLWLLEANLRRLEEHRDRLRDQQN